MRPHPVLDVGAAPDPPNGELGDGGWKVFVRPHELVHALSRHAKQLCNLWNAHQIEHHGRIVEEGLTYDNPCDSIDVRQ
jgi:hypothetical protein